jgi:hypothetical protein
MITILNFKFFYGQHTYMRLYCVRLSASPLNKLATIQPINTHITRMCHRLSCGVDSRVMVKTTFMKLSLGSDTVLILRHLNPLHTIILFVLKIFSRHVCSMTKLKYSTALIYYTSELRHACYMLHPSCFVSCNCHNRNNIC